MKLAAGEFMFDSIVHAKVGDIVEAIHPGNVCVITGVETNNHTSNFFEIFTYKVRPATETEKLLHEVLND